MNRITEKLSALKAENKKALVSYIVAGDPSLDASVDVMHALVAEGTDIIELGVPFSDPMAEGPAIQLGHERALAAGASLKRTLEMAAEFRKTDTSTPIVLMGYLNPIEKMGYQAFAERASQAGADGVIIVDLPPEEGDELHQALKASGMETIFLLAPTTRDERCREIAAKAGGFLYYVSMKGVTGANHLDVDEVQSKVEMLKGLTDIPVLVGFGIKDADTARQVGSVADGVVVGSAFVRCMGDHAGAPTPEIVAAVGRIVSDLRKGLDG